jgi:tetratricopeptide (TPR) repeat protein
VRVASSALLVVIALAGQATAQTPTPADEAFKSGRELMKAGRYNDACIAFEQSYALDPALGTLFNLAQCNEMIGKLQTAAMSYREILAKDTNPQRIKASADILDKLARRIPKLHVVVTPKPAGLTVTVTNLKCGSSPCDATEDRPVDFGTYTVVAKAPGYADATGSIRVDAENRAYTVELKLTPTSASSTTTTTTTSSSGSSVGASRDDGPPRSHRKAIGIGVLAVGGAAAVTGVVFGSLARSKWNDAKAVCGGTTCSNEADLARANGLASDARSRGNASTVLVAAGGVAVAAGVVLWLTAPSEHAIQVTPAASSDEASVTISGRF